MITITHTLKCKNIFRSIHPRLFSPSPWETKICNSKKTGRVFTSGGKSSIMIWGKGAHNNTNGEPEATETRKSRRRPLVLRVIPGTGTSYRLESRFSCQSPMIPCLFRSAQKMASSSFSCKHSCIRAQKGGKMSLRYYSSFDGRIWRKNDNRNGHSATRLPWSIRHQDLNSGFPGFLSATNYIYKEAGRSFRH